MRSVWNKSHMPDNELIDWLLTVNDASRLAAYLNTNISWNFTPYGNYRRWQDVYMNLLTGDPMVLLQAAIMLRELKGERHEENDQG